MDGWIDKSTYELIHSSIDTLQDVKRDNRYNLICYRYLFKRPHPISDIPSISGTNPSSEGEEDNMEVDNQGKVAGQKRQKEQSSATPKKKPAGGHQSEATPTKGKKPICKYGVKCYQKSHEHREKFAHPWVSPTLFICQHIISLQDDSLGHVCAGIKVDNVSLEVT